MLVVLTFLFRRAGLGGRSSSRQQPRSQGILVRVRAWWQRIDPNPGARSDTRAAKQDRTGTCQVASSDSGKQTLHGFYMLLWHLSLWLSASCS